MGCAGKEMVVFEMGSHGRRIVCWLVGWVLLVRKWWFLRWVPMAGILCVGWLVG
jgi:hypothetical protein